MEQTINLYKLLADRFQKKEKYFKNYLAFVKIVKERAQNILPDVKVLIFGSVIKGEYLPSSDIDILIISEKVPPEIFAQTKIKYELLKDFEANPFELHLVTPKVFENWYKLFIKNDYLEV